MTAERVRLTEAQRYWLAEIANPSDMAEPFPPMNTVKALVRRGLVVAERDNDDVFSLMTGALTLRITPAGRLALKEEPTNG